MYKPKFILFAALAVMAIALLVGHAVPASEIVLSAAALHTSPDMLAGLGFAPLAIGNVSVEEIKRLIENQGDAWQEFKKVNDSRLKTLESTMREVEKKLGRPSLDFGGNDISGEDREYKQAFMSYLRTGRSNDLETKAMSAGSDPDGGYLVPKQLDTELTKVLRDLSPMRQIARVIPVDSGDFSMLHSVGGTGYSWVGETAARAETNTPTFKKITPVIGEVYANPGLTQTVLEDSTYDLEAWIVQELSEAFDAAEGDAFVNGNGIVKPRGILTYDIASTADGTRSENAIQYVASGASGDFAASDPADKLFALVHSMKPAYRKGAAWLMNTSTLEQIRTFKDSVTGGYIWRASLEAGQPGTLLGYPVYEDENMPDVSADSLSIAFGNFQRGYTIVDRSTQMLRDPFTNKPYVHFYTTRRVGGSVRDTRAIKLMKFAAS